MIRAFAEKLRKLDNPFIVSHIDADGICSAAIISTALERIGKKPDILAIRQLDSVTIGQIPRDRDIVFLDMGSGQLESIDFPCLIIDHHAPIKESENQLNSHHLGYAHDEASASTLAFFLARELGDNDDLAPIAVVGAIGDMMDRSGMKGLNLQAAEIAKQKRLAVELRGLAFFGRETRALPVFLEYASDPYLPGLTANRDNCLKLLEDSDIKLRETRWRTYHDLLPQEKQRLITALHVHAISCGLEPWQIKRMLRPYYVFPKYSRHTELRDATEFSTLLNACGRNERPDLAIRLAKGDLSVFPEAQAMLRNHRLLLRRGIEQLSNEGARQLNSIQYFRSDEIKPTLIGVVIGMALGSRIIDPNKVAIGISAQEGGLKISSRTVKELTRAGVNLSIAMREASKSVGGEGGGHDIAAGAMIPEDKLEQFLKKLDELISSQLRPGQRHPSQPDEPGRQDNSD